MKTNAVKILCAGLLAACALSVNATTIDIDAFADGPLASAAGVTFSLAGTGEAGTPSVSAVSGPDKYLWNSTDSYAYPTNSILRAVFSGDVSGVLFDFNNWGGKLTNWSLFDSANTLIVSGALIGDSSIHTYDLSTYTGVRSIEFNNNGNDWVFGLNSLTFTEVPEPMSFALAALGLLAIGFSRKAKA
jgi:hypothetical protein